MSSSSKYLDRNDSVSIITNRPQITKVAVLYVVVAIIAIATAASVFYLLLRREADNIKRANNGQVIN